MYFSTTCPNPDCQQENRAEFTDNGIHDLTCSHCGTRYVVFLLKQKFEVLFDLGTRALLDGYAREAVSSFSAALERFFEFYVRAFVLARHTGADREITAATAVLDATWKHVVSQSERQMGMFVLAYLLREGREPDFLTAAALGTDFRNRVIHRGYLPRREEVEQYAAQIFALLDRLLTELGETAQQAEALQMSEFDLYRLTLPADVISVFEQQPGMFRARLFGGLAPLPKPQPAGSGSTKPGKVLNEARAYQKALFNYALNERGELLKTFKGH